jgi:hypothetical protein
MTLLHHQYAKELDESLEKHSGPILMTYYLDFGKYDFDARAAEEKHVLKPEYYSFFTRHGVRGWACRYIGRDRVKYEEEWMVHVRDKLVELGRWISLDQ